VLAGAGVEVVDGIDTGSRNAGGGVDAAAVHTHMQATRPNAEASLRETQRRKSRTLGLAFGDVAGPLTGVASRLF
jgi:hypothetical protein